MWTPRSRKSARSSDEAGAGLFSTSVGVLCFLLLMLVAVQVAFNLYARSAVTAAAFDAARIVAGSDAARSEGELENTLRAAEERARTVLGAYGEHATFEWNVNREVVRLTVRAPNPSFLPPALRLHSYTTTRTVQVRVEDERDSRP